MPATVQIQSGRATWDSWSNATNIRFKNADNDLQDTNDPLVKPSAGNYTWSWEKVFRLWVTQGPSNSLSNLRFHRVTGGTSIATGIVDYCGARPAVTSSSEWTSLGRAPVGGNVQAKCQNTVPTSATLVRDFFGQTNGAHNDFSGSTSTPAQYGPYIYVQWRIDSTASPGTTTSVTYRWTFDEA